MIRRLVIQLIFIIAPYALHSQCFATAGNPVGGTSNLGTMEHQSLRISTFYRYFFTDRYFSGAKEYTGDKDVLQYAAYNYVGFLSGYGLTDWLTAEAEGGYFFNKTQVYEIEDTELTGKGLSNLIVSLKPRIYHNPDKRFEVAASLGANIPFSTELQMVDGVVLPMNVQPTTGSYGLVFQSHIIKENSFRGMRFFLVSRIEKYFENSNEFLAGDYYSNAFFFSKHYVFERLKLKDWTFILQLRNQVKKRNEIAGQTTDALGNCLFFFTPQVNLTIRDHWNVSVLSDIPLYQYYSGIQIGNQYSFALTLIRDFSFHNTPSNQP